LRINSKRSAVRSAAINACTVAPFSTAKAGDFISDLFQKSLDGRN